MSELKQTIHNHDEPADLYGKYYGFPQCCVDFYCAIMAEGLPPALTARQRRGQTWPPANDDTREHVMCDECWKRSEAAREELENKGKLLTQEDVFDNAGIRV